MKAEPDWQDLNCVILNTRTRRQIQATITMPPGHNGRPLRATNDPPPYAVFTDKGITFVLATRKAPIVVQLPLESFPEASQEEVKSLFGEAHPKFPARDVQDMVQNLGAKRAMAALGYVPRDRN